MRLPLLLRLLLPVPLLLTVGLLLRAVGLRLLLTVGLLLMLVALPAAAVRTIVHDRLVGDELVTVALQDGAGERFAADDEDAFVVLFQLIDQRNEVAVSADDAEGR